MENPLPPADTARSLVTGASQGIGKAIFLSLARSGDSVLALSRTKPKELNGPVRLPESVDVNWRPLDLADLADVTRCAASLEPMAIRALILCAVDYGVGGRHPATAISAQEWRQVIGTNCIGHCVLVSCLLSKLITNSPGVIINLSSDVAILPGPGRAAYAASKAGLHAMLRAIAAEHSADSLRVYQLIPTFQLLTNGIRRRRPPGFDYSSYQDPAVIADIVLQLLSRSGNSIAPGSYLIRRDGKMEQYSEIVQIEG